MHKQIVYFVYQGFTLLDLSGPMEAFSIAGHMTGTHYRQTVTSIDGGLVRASCSLEVATEKAAAGPCDTLIVVGAPAPPERSLAATMSGVIQERAAQARRTASVCTGAFLLAESGLLDGLSATTHWFYAPRLQTLYPALRVDGDRIYTTDNGVWTSAGMTAGIDMTLALIEEDLGKEIAQATARMLVVYYRRPGGQYQFSSLLDFDPGSDRIRKTLTYARENLKDQLSVEKLAEVAHLSVRQFTRAFGSSVGMSPAKAIERLRVEAARPMVEDARRSFDEIAGLVGFVDPERMCQSFIRTIGHTPQELRRVTGKSPDREIRQSA
jgi:transcriptional regulator GlxA family with amidase domain